MYETPISTPEHLPSNSINSLTPALTDPTSPVSRLSQSTPTNSRELSSVIVHNSFNETPVKEEDMIVEEISSSPVPPVFDISPVKEEDLRVEETSNSSSPAPPVLERQEIPHRTRSGAVYNIQL